MLSPNKALQLINQQKVELEITPFKKKALNTIPNLVKLDLSHEDWRRVKKLAEEQKCKRITRFKLLELFSEIKQIDINRLTDQLSQETTRKRKAQPIFNSNKQGHTHHYKRRRRNKGENSLILSGDFGLLSPIRNAGVRFFSSPPHPAPESQHPDAVLTPGKTGKARPFFRNRQGIAYLPVTPEQAQESPKRSRVPADSSTQESPKRKRTHTSKANLRDKYPGYRFTRPTTINFTITHETIENRKNIPRKVSQKQLVGGVPCIEVFKKEGHIEKLTTRNYNNKEPILIKGHHYHWSHLIAYFLGGEHSKRNLVPATAAANYNILDTIENYIAEKIVNEGVKQIHLEVRPYYNADNTGDIPNILYFNLSYTSPLTTEIIEETVEIKPTSHRRITGSEQGTIGFVRAESENSQKKGEEETPSPKF